MKAFLLFFFKILGLSFLVLELLSLFLISTFRSTNFYKSNFVNNQGPNHYDFIILGSSRGLTSLNTKRIGDELTKKGFNFSVDDTHIGSQRLMLMHLLNSEVTFDTLFLIYETSDKNVKTVSTNDYRFIPFSNRGYVIDYFYEKNANFYFRSARYTPFIAMSYYNVELFFPCLYALKAPNYKYKYDAFGDYDYPIGKTVSATISPSIVNIDFDNTDLKIISQICKNRAITLVLIITPSYKTDFKFVGQRDAFFIVDLSKEMTEAEYFYDRIHLNKKGKEKLTEIFIDQLKSANKAL